MKSSKSEKQCWKRDLVLWVGALCLPRQSSGTSHSWGFLLRIDNDGRRQRWISFERAQLDFDIRCQCLIRPAHILGFRTFSCIHYGTPKAWSTFHHGQMNTCVFFTLRFFKNFFAYFRTNPLLDLPQDYRMQSLLRFPDIMKNQSNESRLESR